MNFSLDYLHGILSVVNGKVRIYKDQGNYIELRNVNDATSAVWQGDDIIVSTQSGRTLRFTGQSRYFEIGRSSARTNNNRQNSSAPTNNTGCTTIIVAIIIIAVLAIII